MPYFPVVPLAKSPSRMAAAALLSSPLFASPSSSASGNITGWGNRTCRPPPLFSSAPSSCGCRALSSECWGPERYLREQSRKSRSSETVLSLRIRAPSISQQQQQQLPLGSTLALALASAPVASLSSSLGFGGSIRDTGALNFGINSNRRSTMTTTTANASAATAPASSQSLHEFTVKDINGEDVDLSKYKGKVLLVVNVASACGLTSGNYTELAEVYGELKDAGLEVLAFPCNQFGGQEPGSNEQIKEFACTRYKAEFPIFDKVEVNGPNTAPVYQFLKAKKGGGILGSSIKWNFAKFLVDQDGFVVERYAPTTSPKKIVGDIKKLLGSPPASGATASA